MARTETTDKASVKNGRSNKGTGLAYNANHNTLEATRLNQAHIDASRMYLNSYIMFNEQGQREKPIKGGQGGFDAREHEKKLYEHFYGEGLEARNQRCIKDGHRERCQTIEQLYSNPKTAPLETIFQVGSTKSVMDKRTRTNALARAWSATITEFQEKYGEYFKPADCALHRDEAEDHIHFRVLLGATDKFGHFVPNQNAALEAMGFERPDPTQPRSRYNNALISFTDALRETFYRECERQGIHIDRNVENYSKRQVTILEYKCEQFRKENQELEQQLKDKNQDVRDAEQKERDAKIRAQAAQEALDKAVGDRNTLNEQIKALTASQSALEAKNEHLSEENQNLKNENKTLKNQKKELEDRKDELETSIEQLQADKDKAQLEAERAKADRQAALDAAKEIEAAQKRLYQLHDGRSAKTHGTVPAQPAKKNWKGQVIQAARPECTLVETASLQSLEKAAAYHYMVDYAQDQMGQLDKKIAENEIIQSLKQQISDQQTKINELEQQSGKQQLTISNYEYFLEQKGLTAEFEQPAQTQEHTHHFHP